MFGDFGRNIFDFLQIIQSTIHECKHFDVTFKVNKSLKDDSIETITVRNISSDNPDSEEKESYLVFAIKHKDNLFAAIYCCTHTRKISGVTKANEKSTLFIKVKGEQAIERKREIMIFNE